MNQELDGWGRMEELRVELQDWLSQLRFYLWLSAILLFMAYYSHFRNIGLATTIVIMLGNLVFLVLVDDALDQIRTLQLRIKQLQQDEKTKLLG